MDTIVRAVPKPEEIRAELRQMLAKVRIARSLLKVSERLHAPQVERSAQREIAK